MYINIINHFLIFSSRWRKADGNRFGNEIYQVEFNCPLFGGAYNFSLEGVVDCPEFLVHFKTLEKIAKKFGLKLVMYQSYVLIHIIKE